MNRACEKNDTYPLFVNSACVSQAALTGIFFSSVIGSVVLLLSAFIVMICLYRRKDHSDSDEEISLDLDDIHHQHNKSVTSSLTSDEADTKISPSLQKLVDDKQRERAVQANTRDYDPKTVRKAPSFNNSEGSSTYANRFSPQNASNLNYERQPYENQRPSRPLPRLPEKTYGGKHNSSLSGEEVTEDDEICITAF